MNNQPVLLEGNLNQYSKFIFVQNFKNLSWQIHSLFKNIAVKKTEYLNLITNNKVNVSFKNTEDTLTVIYESFEDLEIAEWKMKIKVMNDFLQNSFFNNSNPNPELILRSKSLNEFLIKDLSNLADMLSSQIKLYDEFGFLNKEFAMQLYKAINTLSDGQLSSEVEKSFLERFAALSKTMSLSNHTLVLGNVGSMQVNNAENISDTNINYTTMQSEIKNKLKPTKNKFVKTLISVVISSIVAYMINQLPPLQTSSSIDKIIILISTVLFILTLAFITYFQT